MSDMQRWERVDAGGRVHRASYRYGTPGPATTTLVDLGDGRLVLLSPPGDAALYNALEGMGEVVAVVAPNGFHRFGLPMAAKRCPKARFFAPERAVARAAQKLDGREVRPLEALAGELPEDVEIFVPPHMKSQDTVVRVHTAEGVIWTLHDLLLNMEEVSSSPVERWVLGLLDYRPGLRINRFGLRWVLLGDRAGFRGWLLGELERLPPAAVVFGHGPALREGLERVAEVAAQI